MSERELSQEEKDRLDRLAARKIVNLMILGAREKQDEQAKQDRGKGQAKE
ncbi:MAG: hypothetical protein R8J85_01510 [Mariprofundales bacterium]